jgi:hypothetical protein
VARVGRYDRGAEKFVYDGEKQQEISRALERKREEQRNRKKWEARMVRKATRAGKEPGFYLTSKN